MTAILLSLLGHFWPYIIAGLAALAALWKAHSMGAEKEKAKQAEKEASARSEAQAIDDAIAGRSPSANRDELRKWSPK